MSFRFSRLFCLITLLTIGILNASDFVTKGHTPGKWTMDLEAAKKVADEKKLPILLNFSGSDWCHWCKVMEKNVFTKEEWADYAKDNIVMVLIDFPQNQSAVPEEYKARNNQLKDAFQVQGFPAFFLIESDGKTPLGRFGAGGEKTPQSFINELKPFVRYRAGEIKKYADSLDAGKKAEYLKLTKAISDKQQTIEGHKKSITDLQQKIKDGQSELLALKASAQAFRVAQLDDAARERYQKVQAAHAEAKSALEAWISTSPARTEENMKTFQEMNGKLQSLNQQLAQF